MKPKPLIPDAYGPKLSPPTATFSIMLRSTPRSARLAWLLVAERLTDWGVPRRTDCFNIAVLIVAELAGNAVRHCADAGWDFSVQVTMHPAPSDAATSTLRIESPTPVPTDHCGATPRRPPDCESGRGLSLVEALTPHWGCVARDAGTKSVWAEATL
ncbi:ATP-binding protein [Embleya sp. NPDC050493]|uniref:ATP-binding protein n=1 Tax=Embleya sp. NPDC050493 TaxID=3363989 RepID=UPI0037A7028C